MTETARFIVLPVSGFRDRRLTEADKLRAPGPAVRLAVRGGVASGCETATTNMRVLDGIREGGPRLVEMSADAALNLQAEVPGLRVIPVVTYHTMEFERGIVRPFAQSASNASAAGGVVVRVVDGATQTGLAGARVVAFTSFRFRTGAEGISDDRGNVALSIPPGTRLDRLYVYGPARYWGFFDSGITLNGSNTFSVPPIDFATDRLLLSDLYQALPLDGGVGVRVGVIDTGIAQAHSLLPNVTGGANLVFDETVGDAGAAANWGPAASDGEHGTHVAGIIGARPQPDISIRGVAPGVELRSYRVFPNGGGGATNYDIMNAIDRAVADGCDIVNLSLGGGSHDDGVQTAIEAALSAGTLVVAAAGNDYRGPVSFPASLSGCIAVSAMGRRGTYPPSSTERIEFTKPYGTDPQACCAAFSNYGPQIKLTGPGLGIVSALPDDAYGVMSGTSMACPAVTGFAAFLLARNNDVRAKRGLERVAALRQLLADHAKPVGFGTDYEGFGMLS
ncbi:S8 family serine peptidase [Azospirillum sp. B4]|uniref:S8 family peptidase n=1 Tax=Azospirillum sp. B4 TaxID=95605 RepID=UPI00034CEB56|nr:S8 family serine peptidase [Azospirillum sp. B4]